MDAELSSSTMDNDISESVATLDVSPLYEVVRPFINTQPTSSTFMSDRSRASSSTNTKTEDDETLHASSPSFLACEVGGDDLAPLPDSNVHCWLNAEQSMQTFHGTSFPQFRVPSHLSVAFVPTAQQNSSRPSLNDSRVPSSFILQPSQATEDMLRYRCNQILKVAIPKAKSVQARRMFRCDICQAEFQSGQALGGHASSHSKSRKDKCESPATKRCKVGVRALKSNESKTLPKQATRRNQRTRES